MQRLGSSTTCQYMVIIMIVYEVSPKRSRKRKWNHVQSAIFH